MGGLKDWRKNQDSGAVSPPTKFLPDDNIVGAVTILLETCQEEIELGYELETLVCHACGEWNAHAPECFVPALKRWVES